jgi:type IV pilus assembly protein PilV
VINFSSSAGCAVCKRQGFNAQQGFTLIEVLVSLLVLLIGLLGVAGMQYLALQQVNNANLRSQVNLQVQELVEQVRANDNALPGSVDDWETRMQGTIPEAELNVQILGSVLTVSVTWDERQYGNEAAEQSYTMTARLDQ